MPSPLRVLGVELTDPEAALLASSLKAAGLRAEVERASEREAPARIDASFDAVVLGQEAGQELLEALTEQVRSRHLPAYVVALTQLEPEDALGADLAERVVERLTQRAEEERDAHAAVSLLAVLDTGPSEVYVLNAQTLQVRYANEAAIRNSGYSRRQLLHLRAFELAARLGEDGYRAAVQPLATRERDVLTFATEHRRRDGSSYPITLHLRWTQRGREAMFIAIGQDQTKVQRLERESDRGRLLRTASRDGVLFLDASGRVLEANEAAARLYGKPARALVGSRADDLVVAESARKELAPGQVLCGVHRRGDGTTFEGEVLQRAGDVGGQPETVRLVRDVTRVRPLTLEEHDAAASLRAILQLVSDAIIVLDGAGRVTTWSASAERLLGWSAAEVMGHAPAILPPEGEQEWRTLLRLVEEGSSLGPIQVTRVRRDGALLALRLTLSPLRGRGGRVRGTVAILGEPPATPLGEVERAHLLAALDALPEEVYLLEPDTRQVLFANGAATQACGLGAGALLARTWPDLEPAPPGEPAGPVAPGRHHGALVGRDGERRTRQVTVTSAEGAGAPVEVVVASRPEGASERALVAAGLGVVRADSSGTVLSVDAGARRWLGAAPTVGASIGQLARLAGAPELLDLWRELERAPEARRHISVDGRVDVVEVVGVVEPDASRTLVVGLPRPSRSAAAPLLDAVTGAAPPELQRPDEEWSAAIGVELGLSWEVTAVLGRAGAEAAVVKLAGRARAALPAGAALLRGRGDLLVGLLADADPAAVEELALRLRAVVQPPFSPDGIHEVRPAPTIAVATGARGVLGLLLGVEAGLARARQEGARLTHTRTPVLDGALERHAREQAFRHALARGELTVSWEPQVDLAAGRVTAYVARPAWQDGSGSALTGEPLLALARRADPAGWLELLARAARPLAEVAGRRRIVLPTAGPLPGAAALLARVLGPAAEAVRLETASGVETADDALVTRVVVTGALDPRGWAGMDGVVLPGSFVAALASDAAARAALAACAAATEALELPLIATDVDGAPLLEALRAGGCTEARGPGVRPRLTTEEARGRLELEEEAA